METLFQDLRYGVKVLLRTPGFTVIAVVTLMLGVGASSIIFTLLNAVVLRPLPYPNAERLVQIWETNVRQGTDQETASAQNFKDWDGQQNSFEQIAAYRYAAFILTDEDQPERIIGANVSSTFFSALGVEPLGGRNFQDDEDSPGRNKVAIISNALWQRRFSFSPNIIGQKLMLNGESYLVVGIMPRDFQFPELAEIWAPLGLDLNRVERGTHFLSVIGQLRSGVTLEKAQSDLSTVAGRLEQQFPATNAARGVSLISLQEQLVGKVKRGLFLLFGAVGLLLLIACVNVANLLLARTASKQKERAIRSALGASRLRLVQQSLIETLLIALVGAGLGLLLAFWGSHVLIPVLGANIPRVNEISLDIRVLVFTFAVSILAGVLSGILPALSNLSLDLNEALKEGGRGATGRRHRLRDALIVTEIAFALLLLMGAGLLINSLFRLRQVNTGFDRENVLTLQVSLPRSRYSGGLVQIQFFRQVLEKIQASQGVEAAGVVSDLPFSGSRTSGSFEIQGRPPTSSGEVFNADLRIVSPNYFQAIGIPLLDGSGFADSDDQRARGVAIINQAMAERYWSAENPIGKQLIVGSPEERALYGGPIWRMIVGIVGDVKHERLDAEAVPEIYVPYLQCPSPRMAVVLRTVGNPSGLVGVVKNAVQNVDPAQPVYNLNTMEERVSRSISSKRMNTYLLSGFAAIALVLVAIGVYGVISYSVNQQMRDIGIRMALGAQRLDILKLIVGKGMLLTLIGLGIGILALLSLTRLISSFMFEISTADPLTLISVSALLIAIAFMACYIPARRATRIDPMSTLRGE